MTHSTVQNVKVCHIFSPRQDAIANCSHHSTIFFYTSC
uniref:Uncharacterized protein n=1 Tax=Ascaris lumbricoides TaxID=6252 RepID=A0A0M3IIQ8_ASCLU